ncbi:MAG TPA: hypothetical protein V6C99_11230 [Oculatellaceae cyanobacterium]
MKRIIDFNQSRLSRAERQEQFRNATEDLMTLLEKYRATIPEEFMTFLLALAASEQAIHYANQANSAEVGLDFLGQMAETAEQLYEIHLRQPGEKVEPMSIGPSGTRSGQIVEFERKSIRRPVD